MLGHHHRSSKTDRFLLDYNADELRIAGEFLSNWFPFLSLDFCSSCTHTLSRRIRFLGREAVGDAEQLKQHENFTVLTPELPDSNGCNGNLDNCYSNSLGSWQDCVVLNGTADTNSLGSWKDGAVVQGPSAEALARRNKSDSYVGGADRSLLSLKGYADLNDTADTNSLGSWKDGAVVQGPSAEALARRNKSDSYVGGADRSLLSLKGYADLNDTADTNSLGSWKDGADVQEPFDEALAPRNKSVNYVGGADRPLGSWKDCADLNDTADTNSLGSWKDGADVQEPFDEALVPRNKSDSYVGVADRSLGSWKDCADLNDTVDTNSLGSWKDGADVQEPFDEALSPRNKSDNYSGGADHSSRPVKETSRSKTFRSSRPAAIWTMKMPLADMSQEDELDAEEISESSIRSSQLRNGNGVNKEETSVQGAKPKMELSREHREHIRFCNVKRKKDFICLERVNGKIVNILDGLELHTSVFSMAEQNRIVKFVEKLEEMGRKRTYTAPQKWMRGKGRVTIQFGCCYNYATDKKGNSPGILKSVTVDPLPDLLKNMIRRLVKWHVLPPDCVPDSCVVNIYDVGDCIPPHIDSNDFVRPFCTVSFLSECNIVLGSNLKTVGPGDFAGAIAIPLPMGSVLVLNGNGADVAKHCVPAVPTKRYILKVWNFNFEFLVNLLSTIYLKTSTSH
uniref:Oxidoreductase n=1 Tax=Solanum tuberosum TaxID=4113 RepID=M1C7D5_SOLTU